ncbi:MAG: cupredoxin domain-containing protein [Actinomycetota bacterium]|nr:cupredoxin domain-containing protein [Actinomycetota bacterium]
MRIKSLIVPLLATVIVAGLALALAGGNGTPSAAKSAATGTVRSGQTTVAISNYAFAPVSIAVKAGTRVTWVNHDQTAHTATANQTGFDTGTVNAGASKTVDLKHPGTYAYHCSFHAFMTATVKVVP